MVKNSIVLSMARFFHAAVHMELVGGVKGGVTFQEPDSRVLDWAIHCITCDRPPFSWSWEFDNVPLSPILEKEAQCSEE